MARCLVSGHARTLLVLTTPALWPLWPFLPVVRRGRGKEELGVVFDARAARWTGDSVVVFLTNVFHLPPSFEEFRRLPHERFDTAEELIQAGWQVD